MWYFTEIMHRKSFFFVCFVVISILTICLYFSAFSSDFKIHTLLETYIVTDTDGFVANGKNIARRKNEIKTLLFWNTFFGDKNFYFGEGDVFHDCPVNKCKFTNDRNYLNVEEFDAILFHGNEMSELDIPMRRTVRQFYVYVNLESPANRPIPYEYCENYFNLTMTYRLDSDIPWTYAIIEEIKSGKIIAPRKNVDWSVLTKSMSVEELNETMTSSTVEEVVKNKTKLVAWFVSNCKAKSGRQNYVEELSKYITVDIYGSCGKLSCDRHSDCFRDIVEPNYFFYLSFENSFCDDYVTEKLMNPLRYNVVPVVYGGANYTQFAPPNSYVNALDFESPRELAAYLKYLSQDLQVYQSFFRWKKHYRIIRGNQYTVCTLCEVLHKRNTSSRYSPLSDWYAKDKCRIQTLLDENVSKYATKQIRNLKLKRL